MTQSTLKTAQKINKLIARQCADIPITEKNDLLKLIASSCKVQSNVIDHEMEAQLLVHQQQLLEPYH